MTNKTIKFKDVPIGAKFKTIYYYRKITSDLIYNYATGNIENVRWFFNNDMNQEVKLITKCENCKHFKSHYINDINEKEIYCRKLNKVEYVNINTFSCSLFEQEDRG